MAFKIVRNDITKVVADIIVNTANPKPKCVSGTDLAIYEAAGKEALLAERKTIGPIERGEIAVTGAYNLNAKYIIHTVGPVWIDGNHHELEILERCYRLPLQKAIELGCQSIAFPLISTGVYEFPKDKALHIAVSVFSQFLTEHEIEIILVVFDKTSFQLSSQIVGEIDSYIDANYVKESHINEYPLSYGRSARLRSLFNSTLHEEPSLHLSNTSLEDQLANIGPIERGEIAVTGAYNLNAKYIIHTVGPVWIDGNHHELEILERCYRLPLQKAIELGCQSIAFPLISTGVYEFPKDKALHIAVSVFSQFLTEHEIEIILVVFDKTSFQLSSQIVGEIDSYIDANYVKESHINEYPLSYGRSARLRSLFNSTLHEEPSPHLSNTSLEDQLANIGPSFHDKLFELIEKAHLVNKDVWKRANLDRKLFSKIQCNKNYHPKKKTVFALCIALQLNLEESKDLLARADWAFSPSSKVDLIVQKAIIDKHYDIMELNITLFKYTNETLGA